MITDLNSLQNAQVYPVSIDRSDKNTTRVGIESILSRFKTFVIGICNLILIISPFAFLKIVFKSLFYLWCIKLNVLVNLINMCFILREFVDQEPLLLSLRIGGEDGELWRLLGEVISSCSLGNCLVSSSIYLHIEPPGLFLKLSDEKLTIPKSLLSQYVSWI